MMAPYAVPKDPAHRQTRSHAGIGPRADLLVRIAFVVLAIGSSGLATESRADTLLVLPDGTGDVPTIEAAITASADGDTILLGDGGFHGPGNRDVSFQGKAVTVRSAGGDPEACTIFCNGSVDEPHRGFLFTNEEPAGAVLQDVTITGGCALQGGAVHVFDGATPTIVGCVFRGNQASGGQHGGGAVCATYSTRIEDCLFENNVGRSGGGLLLRSGGGVIVTGCTFRNNEATANGGAIYYAAHPRVEGCLFIGNWAGGDGGALYGGSIDLGGSTFAGNSAGGGAGALSLVPAGSSLIGSTTIIHNSSGSGGSVRLGPMAFTEFTNVIIAFDTAGRAVDVAQVPPLFFCCDLYGNAGGDWVGPIEGQLGENGNIALDPLLCGPAWEDFGLRDDSPCRPFSDPNPECGTIGAHSLGCQTSEAACCIGTACEVLTAEACYLAGGVWQPGIESCDPNPCDADTILVQPDGSGDVPHIQEALDSIAEGGTILLADGVFAGFGNRDLDFHGKAVTLRSQSGSADGCVIDCAGGAADPHRAIDFTEAGAQTRIESITMRNGFADRGGAIHFRFGSSPTIHGCVFENNEAPFRGGALYVDQGSPHIEACTFSGNQSAGEGGALHFAVGSQVDLADCRFETNLAEGLGGGIHVHAYCDGEMTRCAWLGNHAPGGGGLYLDGTILLERCTFCANESAAGSAIGGGANAELTIQGSILAFGAGSPPVACAAGQAPVAAACCDLYGNEGGDWVGCVEELAGQFGNFSADPLFCDPSGGDLYLNEDSPCADPPGCGLVGAYGIGCGYMDVSEGEQQGPPLGLRLSPSPSTGRISLECVFGPEAASRPASLRIFDANGRCVATLMDVPRAGRRHRMVWNGCRDDGRPVAAGIYYAHLAGGGREDRRSVLILR